VIYAALAALAGVVAALVVVMRWGMKAKDETMRATDRLHAQTKMADETIMALVKDRDEWKQRADICASQLAVAKVRLATAEQQRNEAGRIAVDQLVTTIKGSDAQAAIDAIGGLLRMPLGPVPQASPAASGDGDRGAAGVQPPGPPRTVR